MGNNLENQLATNTPHESGRWTSRKRLLCALSGGVPDRVPINTYELAGRDSLDWYNQQPSYHGLMEYIRQKTDCITNWNPRPASDRYTCQERFLCSDFPVEIETHTESTEAFERTTQVCHTPKGTLQSIQQRSQNVYTTWRVEHWCKSIEDVDKALSVPYEPAKYDASDLPRVKGELGDHGIILASVGDPAYLAADLMSFQDFLMWAYENTDHFAKTVDTLAERVLENLRRNLDCCVVDAYRIVGPEYFTPPYLSPAFFKRFVLPHVAAMVDLIHSRGAKARIHCHGKIAKVLDMALATGCDGIDPCEPPPDGDMELGDVKQACQARRVSVWGNIELKLLETGSVADVRSAVEQAMRAAKTGGGFVLMPTAAPINVPLSSKTEENYHAFIDAGLEFGSYS